MIIAAAKLTANSRRVIHLFSSGAQNKTLRFSMPDPFSPHILTKRSEASVGNEPDQNAIMSDYDEDSVMHNQ